MNHAYRLVWNARLSLWVAVCETARGRGKVCGTVKRAILAAGLLSALNAMALDPGALPTGGQVSAGQASIQASGVSMTINQASERAAIDWQSFNIGGAASVTFNQPGAASIALNRVLGQDASQIMGRLSSNGQVLLLNPNGVLFGASAQVNVGGMVATTLGLSNDDFMAGNHHFTGNSSASVVNQGRLTAADGGYVALLAAQAKNEGVIQARLGSVSLAAGSDVTLNLNNGSLLGLTVNQGVVGALAENSHLIQAEGGNVLMTAKAADQLVSAVVNNSGIIEARGVLAEDGVIRLLGDSSAGIVSNTGALKAGTVEGSARSVLQAGQIEAQTVDLSATYALVQTQDARIRAEGGSIRLDGGEHTYLSGTVDASGGASKAAGGNVTIAGKSITLSATTIDASGQSATDKAGTIRIGGGAHGLDSDINNAQKVSVSGATRLNADGRQGSIVVWSDETTNYFGRAKAGEQGFIEVSSKGTLNLGGTTEVGAGGQILYDPTNIVINAAAPSSFYLDLADPTPTAWDNHGLSATQLANGNIVIQSQQDDFGAVDAGAVYLYNGLTGALISSLYGSAASDRVGGTSVTALSNGNFVVGSTSWNNGAVADAGAVTWGSGTAGVSGVISQANSLVGSRANDFVGQQITALSNGNYVVRSNQWSNGAVTLAGAVTWGSGTAGVRGVISAANSLVGTAAGDRVGSHGITALNNGDYVVGSALWSNGGVANVGAATWGSGTSGVSGVISAANSLIGSAANDGVGSRITALSNGNYVVQSPNWANGTVANAGAVTWSSGTAGITGAVSAANSLVGSTADDQVGNSGINSGITALSNGNYVVASSNWDNGTTINAGAVTWGSGTSGVSGVVSQANSLVGSTADDQIGNRGVTALNNGNYVVTSSLWANGAATKAGAVTWGSGTTGVSGVISAANSLVGSTTNDQVGGYDITALSNGNYVVRSLNWRNGTAVNAGAVTWGSGVAGVSGQVSQTNSLVGSKANDQVGGGGVTALSNGNYVVGSGRWDNGAVVDAGAATWGSGTAGVSGMVSQANSLVGSTADDQVGHFGITALNNGNYVVGSGQWDSGAVVNAGAATWGSGTTGVIGVISAANSLVGSTANDSVGSAPTTALNNGNYVVRSMAWDNVAAINAGAVTWGSGTTGVSGVVSQANSLVGSTPNDLVGSQITALSNGNYVVTSSNWSNGATVNAGALTWGSGTAGVTGAVSAINSLVGSAANDALGSGGITALSNGNYLVLSPAYNSQRGAAWLVMDPANAMTAVNNSSGTANVNPTLLAYAAGAGATVTLQASNNITVNSAVSVAGKLHLLAGNVMTLNAGGTITSTAIGDAIVLSGNTFVNNAGSNALTAATGRWLVYSNGPAGNTFGGLASGNYAVYNATQAANAPATISAGNRYVFAQQPTVAVTATAQNKVYDGSGFGAASYTATGIINAATYGTVFTQDALSGALATAAGSNAGNYAITQGTLAGPTGYAALAYTGANAVITPKAVTLTGMTATSRDYDGTTAAALTGGALSGMVLGQTLAFSGQSGQFDTKDVGNGKAVTVSGVALSDGTGLASNYSIAQPTGLTANITPKAVTVTGMAATSRDYDGTTTAVLTGGAVSGTVLGDTLAFSGQTGEFGTKDVGNGKAVTVNGLVLGNGTGTASNYSVTQPVGITANITPKAVTITGMTAASRTYDATTAVTLSGGAVAGTVMGETLAFSGQSGQFDTKNVGIGKAVTVTGLVLGDGTGAASNYSVTQPTGVTGNITAKSLTAGYTADNKVFDGSTSATVTGSSADIISGDAVNFSQTAAFVSAGTGVGKPVNISSIMLSGIDAGNYALQNTTATASANITAPPEATAPALTSNTLVSSDPFSAAIVSAKAEASDDERRHLFQPGKGGTTPKTMTPLFVVNEPGVRMPESAESGK